MYMSSFNSKIINLKSKFNKIFIFQKKSFISCYFTYACKISSKNNASIVIYASISIEILHIWVKNVKKMPSLVENRIFFCNQSN